MARKRLTQRTVSGTIQHFWHEDDNRAWVSVCACGAERVMVPNDTRRGMAPKARVARFRASRTDELNNRVPPCTRERAKR